MARVEFENLEPPTSVLARRYRVTLPLINFGDRPLFGFYDAPALGYAGRVDLGRDAVLVKLDESESSRLARDLLPEDHEGCWSIDHRLEILDVPTTEIYQEATLLLRQFMLVVRAPVPVVRAVVDYKVGGTYYRGGYIALDTSTRNSHGFPRSRIETLKALRVGMGSKLPQAVLRCLDHYDHSVRSLWRGEFDDAFVMAALGFESLLGHKVYSEISYRLCLRATRLCRGGEDLFKALRALYARRSKIVHGGEGATRENVTHLQQALMRLIPSVAALTQECGSYERAIAILDALAFGAEQVEPRTVASSGWWSYVPIEACLTSPAAEAGVYDPWGADVRLYDYGPPYEGA